MYSIESSVQYYELNAGSFCNRKYTGREDHRLCRLAIACSIALCVCEMYTYIPQILTHHRRYAKQDERESNKALQKKGLNIRVATKPIVQCIWFGYVRKKCVCLDK